MQCCLSYCIAQRNLIYVWIGGSLGCKGLRLILEGDALQDLIPLLI